MDIKGFKAWAESKKLSTDGETGRNYSYTFYDSKTQAAWDAWQAKAQAVPEWISVKDKFPEIGVYVMVFLEKQGHNPTTYNFCQYTKFGFHLSNVTHWMPLPSAPKTQEQKG